MAMSLAGGLPVIQQYQGRAEEHPGLSSPLSCVVVYHLVCAAAVLDLFLSTTGLCSRAHVWCSLFVQPLNTPVLLLLLLFIVALATVELIM